LSQSDQQERQKLQIFREYFAPSSRKSPVAAIAAMLMLAACDAPGPAASRIDPPGCGQEGSFAAELHGGISGSLDWRADVLACEGMPRPDGEGIRLRFSGPLDQAPDARTIAFIIGVPDLQEDQTGTELPATVTLIEEGTGRFFATRDSNSCWVDIESQDPIDTESGYEYRISGILYCVAPLAELNGGSSISISDLKFAGRVSWESPE